MCDSVASAVLQQNPRFVNPRDHLRETLNVLVRTRPYGSRSPRYITPPVCRLVLAVY